MSKNKETKLWNNSPCCMNYVLNNPSVTHVPRFHIGSIYYRDQVDKPKKIFNQFQKPQLLLQDFRRQIVEASHPKYNTAAKKNKEMTEKQKSKARSMSMTTATNLYQVPSKIQYKYDIHGYRGHHVGEYNVKQIQSRVKTSKRNFSFGRRIDLSRPLNFFPGPGTYYSTQQPSDNRGFARTCMQFRRNPKNIQNPQIQKAVSNKIQTKPSSQHAA